MRNERGDLLYIGKATRLRERVTSYFNGGLTIDAKTAELVSHVHAIETRITRSALDAALLEARMIREHKPPYNRMLKSAAPAFFMRLDLMDPFPRIQVVQRLNARRGLMHIGPFIGRRNLDHAVRALSRLLGLRVCDGQLAPHADFSPCIYGQMGHCASPCNLTISEDDYGARVRNAIGFLRGRTAPILGELARGRDQAAGAMRFEEANRHHRDLEALATMAERSSRLSRVVTENNLVIVLPRVDGVATHAMAYVVLSGRLAMTRELDSPDAAGAIAALVAHNYELYRTRQVERGELEAMTIIARWLKQRSPDDGRLLYLDGPRLEAGAIVEAGAILAAAL
jgi:excinuclease ABC subunit C